MCAVVIVVDVSTGYARRCLVNEALYTDHLVLVSETMKDTSETMKDLRGFEIGRKHLKVRV